MLSGNSVEKSKKETAAAPKAPKGKAGAPAPETDRQEDEKKWIDPALSVEHSSGHATAMPNSTEEKANQEPSPPKKRKRGQKQRAAVVHKSSSPKMKKTTAAHAKANRLLGASSAAYAVQKHTTVGDWLYTLGFYAEYYLLHIFRFLKEAGLFFAQLVTWIFGGLAAYAVTLLKAVERDISAPFLRFKLRMNTLREMKAAERKQHPKTKNAQKFDYVGHGVKSYAGLFFNIFKFLLPIAAAVVLLFTVRSLFSESYALAVEVDGTIIGYVEDETVLEDAQNILRMKIKIAPNQSLAEWEFTPVLSIGTSTQLSSKVEIADQILKHSSEDIVEANGIYINDILVGVTQDGDKLRELLKDLLDAYEQPSEKNAKVDFVHKVEVSEDGGVFFTESIQSFEELKEKLTQIEVQEQTYIVEKGNTLADIAYDGGISLEELIVRNPQFAGKGERFKPEAGLEVLIRRAQPYLQIKVSYQNTEEEAIPYGVVETEDNTMAVGNKRITQKGVEGSQTVLYEYVYIDGELSEKVRLDEHTVVVQEPVAQQVTIGTASPEALPGYEGNGGSGAFGAYLWPVPDATYSSRGFMGAAHRGLDINAPTGTAIYASNGGEVILSGWHWSFGNHIIIAHPDGRQSLYAHCSALYVAAGQLVDMGQLIAAVGSTGSSTGPHLHFEVLENGMRVDPYGFVAAPW